MKGFVVLIDNKTCGLFFIPKLDSKNKWTGHINVHFHYDERISYDEETKSSVLDFMKLANACISLCEKDEDFLWRAYNHKLELEGLKNKDKFNRKCMIETFPKNNKIRNWRKPNKKPAKIFKLKSFKF